MDRIEVIKLDASSFKYPVELVDVYRSIADPFANQLLQVKYEPNPTDMSQLTKVIDYASEQADGFASNM